MSSTEWGETGDTGAEEVNPEELDDVPAGSADEPGEGEEAGGWTPGGGTLGAEGGMEGEEGLAGAGAEDVPGQPSESQEQEGQI